jgi:hypothetical protein
MSQQRLSDMSKVAFDTLIDDHIEGTAGGSTGMSADVFIDITRWSEWGGSRRSRRPRFIPSRAGLQLSGCD